MVRLGRYFLPDQPLHVIQRGNNREAIFFAEADYDDYRGWLADAAAAYGCAIHAYGLMTNHVHLLVTPRRADSLPRTMQSLGRRYVRHINANYRRTGTLWEGCYRAAPIDSEAYFLACCRYIELNPVRAGMVRHPRHYPWSSYAAHARGAIDRLADRHRLFDRLGADPVERQKAYRELFRARRSIPILSTSCVRPRTADRRSAGHASSGRSPRRSAAASRRCPRSGRRSTSRIDGS
jgi:putative transposase